MAKTAFFNTISSLHYNHLELLNNLKRSIHVDHLRYNFKMIIINYSWLYHLNESGTCIINNVPITEEQVIEVCP
jgi:hypothetical protein